MERIRFTDGHLLIFFLLALTAQMFIFGAIDMTDKLNYDLFTVSYISILIIGPYAVIRNGKKLRRTLVAAVVTFILHELSYYYPQSVGLAILTGMSWCVFNMMTAYWFLEFIYKSKVVSNAQIYAGVSIYLLIAFTYAAVYMDLCFIAPDSFTFKTDEHDNLTTGWSTFLYFSLTTLTTVGYGDITPKTNLARFLTMSEAVTGVFYVAVLISRLISLQLMHREKH